MQHHRNGSVGQPYTINLCISPYVTKQELLSIIRKRIDQLAYTQQLDNATSRKVYIYLDRSIQRVAVNGNAPLQAALAKKTERELLGVIEA